ncbi:MAG: hypothetical protein F4Z35_07545 [Dehalococcoidia bacterium]|nr:hypothetical protein [Dehalococcoidia bacterium]
MTTTQSLYQLLDQNTSRINERLFHPNFYGDDHKFLPKKERVLSSTRPCIDEALWTFLAACGYAIGGSEGVAKLTEILTGTDMPITNDCKIWLEARPLPPRNREGNTNLDLAVGAVAQRGTTKSGIELNTHANPWICFCEMKWNSDISGSVSNDAHRNQLVRVIENALCFENEGKYADRSFVTLVTPAIFKDMASDFRFHKEYQDKLRDYQSDYANILIDLDSPLQKVNHYPDDIAERLKTLTLRWVTFDYIFESIPDSALSDSLKTFWKERNEYA